MGEVADPDDPPFAPSRTGDSLYVYGGGPSRLTQKVRELIGQ